MHNDTELINDFLAGKDSAYEELYDRYYERIYFYVYKITHNKEESKDITLNVFVKLFTKRFDFDNLPELVSFLYTAAKNDSINYKRDRVRLLTRQSVFLNQEEYTNEELDAEFISLLVTSIEELPKYARQVIKLRFLEGKRQQEVADILHLSLNTVKNHQANSIKKLRLLFNNIQRQ